MHVSNAKLAQELEFDQIISRKMYLRVCSAFELALKLVAIYFVYIPTNGLCTGPKFLLINNQLKKKIY